MFATLRDGRGKVLNMAWHDGIDGNDVLHELGLTAGDVTIFLINGTHSKLETKLKSDDILALFPPLGGG